MIQPAVVLATLPVTKMSKKAMSHSYAALVEGGFSRIQSTQLLTLFGC